MRRKVIVTGVVCLLSLGIGFDALAQDLPAPEAPALETPSAENPREARMRELFSERAELRTQAPPKSPAVGEEIGASSVLGMLKGLGLCIGIFLIGVYFVKRSKGPQFSGNKRKLKIVERMAISPKSSLVLVSINHRELLLSVGSDRVTVVDGGLGFESEFASAEVQSEQAG